MHGANNLLLSKLTKDGVTEFTNCLWMSTTMFNTLLDEVYTTIKKIYTMIREAISVKTKLEITL